MLKEYQEKRDFRLTGEPPPVKVSRREGPLIFVIQKHAARRLHYDLRLELDGVLKSWSVPEGPSLAPAVKRLAVMVEDHPLDYASFEGVIPQGEYGAGQVIVWDAGDYSPDEGGNLTFNDRAQSEERIRQGLAQGKISFLLRGQKLRGSWTLVKMKNQPNNWLLIKHKDNSANDSRNVLEDGISVQSGMTIEDLKAGKQPPSRANARFSLASLPKAKQASFPATNHPMLAGSADAPFTSPEWLFEPKLDGYRIIAVGNNGKVRLLSRNSVDVTAKYKDVAASLQTQPAAQIIIDGELIAFDKQGKLCFQCLQGYLDAMKRSDRSGLEIGAVIYYAFDLLYLDGYDFRNVPLEERKRLLRRILLATPNLRYLEHFEGDGKKIYQAAVKQGLEGIIAKRKESVYQSGKRSPDWLKIKSMRTDDFVIGGYTRGEGARARSFGALILGYYDGNGKLHPAGQVGSGFDDYLLAELRKRLDTLATNTNPFAETPEINASATWVRPELVAEVKFSEWTRDNRLRTPVFLRLREDKPATEVRLSHETIVSPGKLIGTDPPNRSNNMVDGILVQLQNPRLNLTLDVEGNKVSVTNLDKQLWPQTGKRRPLTKRDLLVYLTRVSRYLLPHLRDRPLTLSRYPHGIDGEHFFQKHWGYAVPDFVATVPLSEHHEKRQEYLLCNNLAALLWLGQAADIELHTWFSRITAASADEPVEAAADMTRYPDFIIFDIDPYIYSGKEAQGAEPELNREAFTRTCEAALWLKETLDSLSLAAFVKTSGRTGLHLHVPVIRQLDYHAVHAAARTICEYVLKRHPKEVTIDWAVEKRAGKVFLDYNQNARGKTLASVYSPRPSPAATVSTPLRWDELGKVYPTDFTILNMPERLSKLGDLWKEMDGSKRDLKAILKLT
ncbi:MAG: DNA ligase D [Dehalococcoidales bacterium]|nr:DNA ligase D [Dehalococcoidales bacterium]